MSPLQVNDPDYSTQVREYADLPDGRIFLWLALASKRKPYPPLEFKRTFDGEADLLLWQREVPRLLAMVKSECRSKGPIVLSSCAN